MRQIADYRLLELLGEGNHGSFWLARTPRRLGIDEPVCAVKVLAQRAGANAFRRMANELQLFAAVGSPYLARLYDAGHQDGVLYYATAYHHRGSLATVDASVPLDVRVRAVADAARGAHALHEAGVAHRDVKPGNVLLTDDGAVLGDLGLAQLLSRGATLTGVGPIGTLAFMEPGVARGETAGRASDVWSLGATALAVATGRGPFPALPTTNLLDALNHVIRAEPQVPGDLSPALRDVLVRALHPEREQRPATALELADQLEGAVRGA